MLKIHELTEEAGIRYAVMDFSLERQENSREPEGSDCRAALSCVGDHTGWAGGADPGGRRRSLQSRG